MTDAIKAAIAASKAREQFEETDEPHDMADAHGGVPFSKSGYRDNCRRCQWLKGVALTEAERTDERRFRDALEVAVEALERARCEKLPACRFGQHMPCVPCENKFTALARIAALFPDGGKP